MPECRVPTCRFLQEHELSPAFSFTNCPCQDGSDKEQEQPAQEAEMEAASRETGEAASSSQRPAQNETQERQRESRKLLSKATTIPPWLREMFDVPDGVVPWHVQHKAKVLPHFQVRLPADVTHEGKYHMQ